MSAAAERAGELRRLAVEVRGDLAAIAELTAFAQELTARIAPGQAPERRDLMALALTLHHVYTATEQALLRIAKAFDRAPYTGSDWHRDLLRNMAAPLPGVRPAVISPDLRRVLDEYRGFRHVVRHGYDYELDWHRMRHLVERLPEVAAAVAKELEAFLAFVDSCIAALPGE